MTRKGRKRLKILIALILAGLGFVYFVFLKQFRPVAQELAKRQVSNKSSDLINDAVSSQISDATIRYDRIIYFEKDINGRITALKTNMGEVNKLKTQTLNRINQEILSLDQDDIGLPLGSLLFPELFSGKGPEIPVKVLSISNSDASFQSAFAQAGINQTVHQLLMDVRIDVTLLVLGKTESLTITSQVVVAETVIVGTVPETFINWSGASKGALLQE